MSEIDVEPAPRRFVQVILMEEGTNQHIVERQYLDGTVEYWATMNILATDKNTGQQANVQIPFRIDTDDYANVPALGGDPRKDRQIVKIDDDLSVETMREKAFERLPASAEAFQPKAEEQFKAMMAQQQKQARSKIMLANALPPSPILRR